MGEGSELSASRARRALLITSGIVGVVALTVVPTVDAATRGDGYDLTRHWVSLLSRGERGWLGTLVLVACGTLVLASAPGFAASLRGRPGAVWTVRMIGLFGVGLVVAGVCPIDPVRGYPIGTRVTAVSLSGRVHGVAGAVVIGSLAAMCLGGSRLFGPRSRRSRVGAQDLSIAAGVVIVASSAVCAAVVAASGSGSWEAARAGACQRLALLIGCSWIAAVGGWLALRSDHHVTDLRLSTQRATTVEVR